MEATQILHIHPYMIYLIGNSRPRSMYCWPLQLFCDIQKWPPIEDTHMTHIYSYMIPFWKRPTNGNPFVTSAADLCYAQKWPLVEAIQKTHIYPNMIYHFENGKPRKMHWLPLLQILVTSKVTSNYTFLDKMPGYKKNAWIRMKKMAKCLLLAENP